MLLLNFRTHFFPFFLCSSTAFPTPYISDVWLKNESHSACFCIFPTSFVEFALFCCPHPYIKLLQRLCFSFFLSIFFLIYASCHSFDPSSCASHSLLVDSFVYITTACPGLILVIWRFHLPCVCETECHKDRQRVCYQEVAKPCRGNSVGLLWADFRRGDADSPLLQTCSHKHLYAVFFHDNGRSFSRS